MVLRSLEASGTVVVDPMSEHVTAVGLDAVIGYAQADYRSPNRFGLQLIILDYVGQPRIADTVHLARLSGAPAADAPFLYVPAGDAGLLVLRIEHLQGEP